jgi:2'-5' RNA ligase
VNAIDQQLHTFDDLWAQNCDRWPPEPIEASSFGERTWTLVHRPDGQAAQAISAVARELGTRWPDLVTYPAARLHFTIVGGGDPAELEKWLVPLRVAIGRAAAGGKPAKVKVAGLGVLKDAVIAQILDLDGRLRDLVAEYLAECDAAGLPIRRRAGLHERLWWLTIARATSAPDAQLREFVARRRRLQITEMCIDVVELVETNKLFDADQTQTLARVRLGREDA